MVRAIGRFAAVPVAAFLIGVIAPTLATAADRSLSAERATEVRRAIDEKRLLDAGRLIDRARLDGVTDPRLYLLTGELGLAGGRFDIALKDFRTAEAEKSLVGEALQGQGLALLALGRPDEATPVLQRATEERPQAWRAWNALGSLYDQKREWARSDEAYAKAMAATDQPAIVLNNRGYSRLLQGKYDLATADFVAALEKRVDLAAARTNLRLALALQGEYDRAIAGTRPEERSVLLNNAGFAAGMRGDYDRAQTLLQQAMSARGDYFARADANLKLVEQMAARGKEPN